MNKENPDDLVELTKVLKIIAVELRRIRWAIEESEASKELRKERNVPRRDARYKYESCDALEAELRRRQ
jgi:hypothetical protein